MSVKSGEDQAEKINTLVSDNVKLIYSKLQYAGEYSKMALVTSLTNDPTGTFGIVVIDGRDRVNCALHCINALKPNGVIIWDDSDRAQYNEGFTHLLENGFKRLDFEGLGPMSLDGRKTSIFYRLDNCLGI